MGKSATIKLGNGRKVKVFIPDAYDDMIADGTAKTRREAKRKYHEWW